MITERKLKEIADEYLVLLHKDGNDNIADFSITPRADHNYDVVMRGIETETLLIISSEVMTEDGIFDMYAELKRLQDGQA